MPLSRSGNIGRIARCGAIAGIVALLVLLPHPSKRDQGQPPEITLLAAGDVMLGRHIGRIVERRGAAAIFSGISPLLATGDIVVANLEALISSPTATLQFPDKPYNFRARPQDGALLKAAGFTVLNLANNHALDYGPSAIATTRRVLAEAGLSFFGAGVDAAEARRPAIVTVKNTTFGFLGYSIAHARRVYARAGRAGVAQLDAAAMLDDIRKLRPGVDVLILSLHWGFEYEDYPTSGQRRVARQLIDAGADLILGHHPHVPQGVEVYRGRIIAYSLGNFLFDQKANHTDEGVMLRCRFSGARLTSAELIPVDREKTYLPREAAPPARTALLNRLRQLSRPLNSRDVVNPAGLLNLHANP